jgi:hypothetical protein
MCTVRQIYSCPVEFPFIETTRALIAALKAREVDKVSQGCPFNRIG